VGVGKLYDGVLRQCQKQEIAPEGMYAFGRIRKIAGKSHSGVSLSRSLWGIRLLAHSSADMPIHYRKQQTGVRVGCRWSFGWRLPDITESRSCSGHGQGFQSRGEIDDIGLPQKPFEYCGQGFAANREFKSKIDVGFAVYSAGWLVSPAETFVEVQQFARILE
jgi:hypothetical protein